MIDQSRPDLLIIGAGALGIALAQYGRDLGGSVVLVDRGRIEEGDGPLGAIKLAAWSASASQAQAQRQADRLGLPASEPKISFKAIHARAQAIAQAHAPASSADRLRALGIDVAAGEASLDNVGVVTVGERHFRPRAMIMAIGGKPVVPDIPGLDAVDFFTPDGILDNSRKLTHLLVIGSDPEGVSLAQVYARLGSEVSLVTQGPFLDTFDPELVGMLKSALAEDGVKIIEGGRVAKILPRAQGIGAVVEGTGHAETTLDVSHVLVALGRVADTGGGFAQQAKLQPSSAGTYAKGPLGQSSNRRVRVVGAAAGIWQWAQALHHGKSVVAAALGHAPEQEGALPTLIQTEPALAQVGTLNVSGPNANLVRVNLAENAAAQALSQGRGLVKVIAGAKGDIRGAGIFGPHAAEIASTLAVAMAKSVTLHDLSRLALPQPSIFSALTNLANDAPMPRARARWSAPTRALLRFTGSRNR